jgi:hypothetical protein
MRIFVKPAVEPTSVQVKWFAKIYNGYKFTDYVYGEGGGGLKNWIQEDYFKRKKKGK